ncbi:hypothetical protein [Deinococcus xianganensis]|uniref:Uncharacterized protein n=1 Tax=Deinococcus xianganensis TaxID=1507289 RepID=A0A6I4Y7J0_9DEIO|nr:hypothetical protein [Deinococcus xianganensis]MXV18319.1 hypothetical protein [Deinococcus xianganensis]
MHREDQHTASALLAFLAAYHQTLGADTVGTRQVGVRQEGHPQPACPLTRAAQHEGEALARAHLG